MEELPEAVGLAPCLHVALHPGEGRLLELAWGKPLRDWLRACGVAARVRPIFPDLDPTDLRPENLGLFRWHRVLLPHDQDLAWLYLALQAPGGPAAVVRLVPTAVEPPANWSLTPAKPGVSRGSPGVGWHKLHAHHRRAAPEGTGRARGAGADGSGIALADVEHGWGLQGPFLRHPYLRHLRPVLLGEPSHSEGQIHGTRSLGVIYSEDQDPPAEAVGVARGEGPLLLLGNRLPVAGGVEVQTTADQIGRALVELPPGSILLVEAQTVEAALTGTGSHVPAEYEDPVYDAVCAATARGIIVVAAAGNGHFMRGATDLDQIRLVDGRLAFQRSSGDSGAILVGAGRLQGGQWLRQGFSNYGSRVDCFAAGEGVLSTSRGPVQPAGGDEDCLCDDFGGTSAAAAIIAGVARVLQGMAWSGGGALLSPGGMRRLLADPQLGTSCAAGEGIGVMPDLDRLAARLPHLPPTDFL